MSISSGHYKWYQSSTSAPMEQLLISQQKLVIPTDSIDSSPSSFSLSIFSGGDGSPWLRQCVRQFRLYDVPENNQVYRAWMALAGEALNWFNQWQKGRDSLLWVEFCVAVLSRFPRPSSSSASATFSSSPCASSKGNGGSIESLPSISLGPSPGILSSTKKQLKQAGIISPRLKDWSQFHTLSEVSGSLFSPPKFSILCNGCEFGTEFWGRDVKKWKSKSSFGFHSCPVCCCLHVSQGEGNIVCFKAPYKELGSAYQVFEKSLVPCLDLCPFAVTASTCVKEVAAAEQLISALPGILVDTEMPVLLRAAVLAREKKATREEENQFAQQNCCYSGVYTENGWCSKLKEPYQESETKNSQIAYLRFKEPQGTETAVQFDFYFGFKGNDLLLSSWDYGLLHYHVCCCYFVASFERKIYICFKEPYKDLVVIVSWVFKVKNREVRSSESAAQEVLNAYKMTVIWLWDSSECCNYFIGASTFQLLIFGLKGTLGDYLLVMVQQLEDKLALKRKGNGSEWAVILDMEKDERMIDKYNGSLDSPYRLAGSLLYIIGQNPATIVSMLLGLEVQSPSVHWDLIQIVGIGTCQNVILLMDKDKVEVFFCKVLYLEDLFHCLDRHLGSLLNKDQPLENEKWISATFMVQLLNDMSRLVDYVNLDSHSHLKFLTEVLLKAYVGDCVIGLWGRGVKKWRLHRNCELVLVGQVASVIALSPEFLIVVSMLNADNANSDTDWLGGVWHESFELAIPSFHLERLNVLFWVHFLSLGYVKELQLWVFGRVYAVIVKDEPHLRSKQLLKCSTPLIQQLDVVEMHQLTAEMLIAESVHLCSLSLFLYSMKQFSALLLSLGTSLILTEVSLEMYVGATQAKMRHGELRADILVVYSITLPPTSIVFASLHLSC